MLILAPPAIRLVIAIGIGLPRDGHFDRIARFRPETGAGSCSPTHPPWIRDKHTNQGGRCVQRWRAQVRVKNPAWPHRGRTGSSRRDVVRDTMT
jgi:hypothetical protein